MLLIAPNQPQIILGTSPIQRDSRQAAQCSGSRDHNIANIRVGITTGSFTTKDPSEPVPRTQREAIASDYWPQYRGAEDEEIENHRENGTWKLVKLSSLPRGAKVLRTKWVYADQKDENGFIVRFKATVLPSGPVTTTFPSTSSKSK